MDKNTNKNIICGWLIGVFITFITMAFFYMTYGIICPLRRMAIIDITQFVPKLSNSSNFFWLVTTSWTVPICFNLGFLTFLVCQSFENCFELKKENHKWMSLLVSVGAMIILAIFNFRLNNMLQFLNNGFVYYVFIVQYILPLIILPILAIKVDKKQKRRFKYVK